MILDVGANVGNHSLAFAQAFDAVHGFEPNPMLWQQFETNRALNRLENKVTLHRCGLGVKDDSLMLHMTDAPNLGLGTFLTVEQYERPLVAVAKCAIRCGDSYLAEQNVDRVDAIKIDVQGFEPMVIQGLSNVIARDRPVIWFEVGTATQDAFHTRADLQAILPFEFDLFRFGRNRLHAVGADEPFTDADYVLTPHAA